MKYDEFVCKAVMIIGIIYLVVLGGLILLIILTDSNFFWSNFNIIVKFCFGGLILLVGLIMSMMFYEFRTFEKGVKK